MTDQMTANRKISAFFLALLIGIFVTTISYLVGNKAGFGAFFLTDEVLNSIIGYDNVMNAFLQSAIWQITAYMLLLLIPKWFIYQDRSKNLVYSFFIYWFMPFVVWISLDDPARFIAFSGIATMVWFERVTVWLKQSVHR